VGADATLLAQDETISPPELMAAKQGEKNIEFFPTKMMKRMRSFRNWKIQLFYPTAVNKRSNSRDDCCK
jgi:hypothetical protein